MVIEYKLKDQRSFTPHACVANNRMLQSCGIDAQRCLSRLLTRPSTCYKAQYVCKALIIKDYALYGIRYKLYDLLSGTDEIPSLPRYIT